MTDLFGNKEIRALSWKEPFATLMLHGKIETRTWPTSYRGLVLICASKQPYTHRQVANISGTQLDRIYQTIKYYDQMDSTLGHAIAVGELVDCWEMEEVDEDKCFVQWAEPWVQDGTKNRKSVLKRLYCHAYKNVRAIKPIPWKGTQGWKKLEQEFINQIEYL